MGTVEDDLKDEIIKSEGYKSDLANTCELLLNEKYRKRKTIIRNRSIPALTTLETLANLYEVQWLREWINSFTEYLTSSEGQGRKDIVDIAKFSIDREVQARKEIFELLGKR